MNLKRKSRNLNCGNRCEKVRNRSEWLREWEGGEEGECDPQTTSNIYDMFMSHWVEVLVRNEPRIMTSSCVTLGKSLCLSGSHIDHL